MKRQLGEELARLLAGRRRWDVAALLGTHAARVSDLRRGNIERFSLETLIRIAVALGQRVSIVVEPDRERRGPRTS